MKKFLKYFLDVGLIVGLTWLTFRLLFKGQELGEILRDIGSADPLWMTLGGLLTFCFVAGESCIIYYMLRVFEQKVPFYRCLKYSFIGFFFSFITPSASGGQPAQMYYMKKDGVKIGCSTLIMLLITIAYKSVLVGLGAVCLIFGFSTVSAYCGEFTWLIILGFVLNFAFIAALGVAFIKPQLAMNLGIRVGRLLRRLRILNREKYAAYTTKLMRISDTYTMSASYVKENFRTVLNIFGLTVIQRLCLFSLTWVIYKAFGLSGMSIVKLTGLQIVIGVAVEMLPLPGAAGITESCFMLTFGEIFGEKLVRPALLLSRGLSFYAVLIVGGVVTLVAHILVLRDDRRIDLQKQLQAQERREAVQARAAAIKDGAAAIKDSAAASASAIKDKAAAIKDNTRKKMSK